MKCKLFISALFVCLSVAMSSKAFGFSLVDDWSDLTNPNGSWSYNQGNTPLPFNIVGWPNHGELGVDQTAWANGDTTGGQIPAWLKTVNDPSIDQHYSYDYEVGDVLVHTTYGSNSLELGPANVTWKNPTAGVYDINGGLWPARDNNKRNDWNLYLNDVLLADGSLFYGESFSRFNPNFFNFQGIDIAEGSVLRLQVDQSISSDNGVVILLGLT